MNNNFVIYNIVSKYINQNKDFMKPSQHSKIIIIILKIINELLKLPIIKINKNKIKQ